MPPCFQNWCQNLITVVFLTLLVQGAWGQEPPLESEINFSNGLPSNAVRSIKLAPEGGLWIGTDNGLAIFPALPQLDSLSKKFFVSKSIWAIAFRDSLAVIGTRYEGLYIINRQNGKLVRHFPKTIIDEIRKMRQVNDMFFILTNKGAFQLQGLDLSPIPMEKKNPRDFLIDLFLWKDSLYGLSFPSAKTYRWSSSGFISSSTWNSFDPFAYYPFFSATSNDSLLMLGSSYDNGLIEFRMNKPPRAHRIFDNNVTTSAPWQLEISGKLLLAAIGDSRTNQKGAMYTQPLDSLAPAHQIDDFVTSFEWDSTSKMLYYGTLHNGLVMKRLGTEYASPFTLYEEWLRQNLDYSLREYREKPENNFLRKDLLITVYKNFIHLWDFKAKRTIKKLPKNNGLENSFFYDAQVVGGYLYLFETYGRIFKYDLQSKKVSPLYKGDTFLPQAQVQGDRLIYLNHEKGFHLLSGDSVIALKSEQGDIAFVMDFHWIGPYLYTLSSDFVKVYQIDPKQKALSEIRSFALEAKFKGFYPRWISCHQKHIYLFDEKGVCRIKDSNGQPEHYYYWGRYKEMRKPEFKDSSIVITTPTLQQEIPSAFLLSSKENSMAGAFSVSLPREIYEHSDFNITLKHPSYLHTYHTLKEIQLIKKGGSLKTYYTLGNQLPIPGGLDYGRYQIFIKAAGQEQKIELDIQLPLNRNPYFFLVIFILVLLTLSWIGKSYLDRKALNRKLTESRIQVLRQNLNPHFVYNSMNMISSLILEGKPDEALRTIADFARLQRTFLETNSRDEISLAQELKFIKNYLDLQLQRYSYDKPFQYNIIIEGAVELSAIPLPPLLLQPIVENSIKHGILPAIAKEPEVLITVIGGEPLQLRIEDNGPGYKPGQHPGFGQKLTAERIAFFNQTHKAHWTIRYRPATRLSGFGAELTYFTMAPAT